MHKPTKRQMQRKRSYFRGPAFTSYVMLGQTWPSSSLGIWSFFLFGILYCFFPSPARWGPLDFIRVASFSSSSSSGSCEFRDLSGHCRTSTASSEVSGHCRPPDPVGTAGPQLRADLSGHCRKINCGCQISVGTAGPQLRPQLRAPDLSGH